MTELAQAWKDHSEKWGLYAVPPPYEINPEVDSHAQELLWALKAAYHLIFDYWTGQPMEKAEENGEVAQTMKLIEQTVRRAERVAVASKPSEPAPGPWDIEDWDPVRIIASAQSGETIANVFGVGSANLIVAAPEMHEALRRVWSDDNAGSLEAEATLDYVAHAIAKAEGRDDWARSSGVRLESK